MALQFSTNTRNAMLDSIETYASTSPILSIRSGAAPSDCATANSGTVLASLTLPSDWMAAAASASKSKSGTWQDTDADAAGTAAHFRIHNSGGTECLVQGTVTITGGGGDLTLDNTNIAQHQSITITGFQINANNG